MTAFKKAYDRRARPLGLMFLSIKDLSILLFHFDSFWILLILCYPFANACSERILHKNFNYLYLNISKAITAQEDRMAFEPFRNRA